MNANITKITDKEILEGLKSGLITINDFTIEDNEVIVDFYSDKLDEELDDITIAIPIDAVVEKLEYYNDNVIVDGNNFYSTSNHSSFVDYCGNLETDYDQEIIDQDEVLDALLELLIEQKPTIKFSVEVSAEIEINLNDFDITPTQWQNMSDTDKKNLVIREFNETRGINSSDIKQAV